MSSLMISRLLATSYFLFFAILFLQSGFDKMFDRKGNLDWMTPHFEKSPIKNALPLLLSVLTVLEVACGAGSAASVLWVWLSLPNWFPLSVGVLILCDFLALFFGQRVSKDYAGAATIAIYFGIALVGMYFMATTDALWVGRGQM